MSIKKPEFFYALSAVLLWSTVATAFKLALRELDAFQLIFIASGVSAGIFFVRLLLERKVHLLFAQTRKQAFFSLLMGALNPAAYYIVLFKAYSLLPAQLAQPLNMVWPIVLTLLSVPFLGQKISLKNWAALGLSFIGVILISSQGGIEGFRNTNFAGVALALISSVMWPLYWILNVKDTRDETVRLFTCFLAGFVYLFFAVLFFSDFRFPSGLSLGAAVYTGFFEVGITYILWLKAMERSSNNAKLGNLVYLGPFISLFFIRLFLKEEIFVTTFIGLALIIAGILFQQVKKRSKIPYGK